MKPPPRHWDLHLEHEGCFLFCKFFVPRAADGLGVVFSHGWGGSHKFRDLQEYLAERGAHVLSLEHRGYGRSTGAPKLAAWPRDMSFLAGWLRERGLRVWMMGLSTGGTMTVTATARDPLIAGGIALASFASLEDVYRDRPDSRGILRDRFGELDDADTAAANAKVNVTAIAPRPIYLVHCKGDAAIPYQHARRIAANAAGPCETPLLEGGTHFFEGIDRQALFEQFLRWMAG
ncbi:MAG: alpha/beta fold hydrolase [Candidatus Tectomicrobia bacterium]|nr:alpha/beta fold hydrolase [Candidatus Tectomicrobia bacterium]